MASPPPKSSVPATVPTVWPPSNPSGTVVPFPLPWGQTGCCPPGGMSALIQCYCDLQQASAFIGQVMLDQINNNPAIIEAIIAGIESSGSSVPLVGVTNGTDAQPGQVGEWVQYVVTTAFAATQNQTQQVTMGVLQPGDWDCYMWAQPSVFVNGAVLTQTPLPAGFAFALQAFSADSGAIVEQFVANPTRALISVPSLITLSMGTNLTAAGTAGSMTTVVAARRRR